ncbi:MAG TPA: BON domain-containing protein, partial [Planctomycetota bacterium]|nr:BON domain-containing protein [Planctomycetota bacterium]
EAEDGLVRLRGEVNSDGARLYASGAAQSVAGVRAVLNELAVLKAGQEESRRLALLILKQLEYDTVVQAVAPMILVTVRNGIVRLEGRVQDEDQLLQAEDLAADQVGVFAVENRLEIDEQLRLQATRRGPYTVVLMR